ncbi:hypothetical protein COO60DRAFT_1463350 [Scenedesmus sp. NREL 46B-D3]|nr:hypothetical protein COO60DRAFT_1463350 [Scenedesmus sp. NREL 46B-D3]
MEGPPKVVFRQNRQEGGQHGDACPRALSRLEQAVATSAAPELIVVACEIKVACNRGQHLFRTYGRYRYLGKLVAAATHSSTTAKYDAVIARLLAIMPSEPPQQANAAGGSSNGQVNRLGGLLGTVNSDSGGSTPRGAVPGAVDRFEAGSTNTVAAAAGVLDRMLKGSADSLSAAACVWWAVGDRLEFYSDATQSTTSFAAVAVERAAITALTLDSTGNVWGGTAQGTVFMRRRTNWQQVFVERAFSSCVRVLAADADSDVVWGGDDAGRLAVFRCRQGSLHSRLECTATILPGKAGTLKGHSSAALAVKPRALSLRHSLSCRTPGESAEGPITALLVRDDHAWVAGGRTQPWLAVFDAVAGTQLDTWSCGSYGSCQAMTYMLTSAALARQAVFPPGLTSGGGSCADKGGYYHSCSFAAAQAAAGIASVPEDGIGEQPRSSWRLITGHDNGQLLLWSGASDRLVPLVVVGEPLGPVRGVTVLEQQGLLVVARGNGDVSLFLRPARDEDWVLPPVQSQQHQQLYASARDDTADGATGVATVSSSGAIKLWTAEVIAREAERGGLLLKQQASTLLSSSTGASLDYSSPGNSGSSLSAATHGGFLAGPGSGAVSSIGLTAAAGAAPAVGGARPAAAFGAPKGLPEIITAPRAPRAQRAAAAAVLDSSQAGGASSRERRKSERRLSRGSQLQWSTCQIIESTELKLLSCIGSGAYGKPGGLPGAASRLPHSNRSCVLASVDSVDEEVSRELKALMDEVFLLGSLTHPSISRFCALCLDPPLIVMQYYSHGSMYDLLKRGRRGDKRALQELTWAKRLDMLRDIASGMVFLHSRRPPIVHGDLRSPNLLLDLTIDRDKPRFHVKIADFGLARMLGPASSITVSKVTNPRWSAPEVIRSSTVSRPADVFSFAVVMWELLTWQQPYEEMMSVQVLFSVMQQYRPEIPPEEELPGKPGGSLPKYIQLMQSCWAEDENARPRFEVVVAALDEMRAADGCLRYGSSRSMNGSGGSRRVSYAEAGTPPCGTPTCATPTGSSYFGGSPPPSLPGGGHALPAGNARVAKPWGMSAFSPFAAAAGGPDEADAAAVVQPAVPVESVDALAGPSSPSAAAHQQEAGSFPPVVRHLAVHQHADAGAGSSRINSSTSSARPASPSAPRPSSPFAVVQEEPEDAVPEPAPAIVRRARSPFAAEPQQRGMDAVPRALQQQGQGAVEALSDVAVAASPVSRHRVSLLHMCIMKNSTCSRISCCTCSCELR